MNDSLAEHFRAIKTGNQILVGITGGIGSGKSAVAVLIAKAGFPVLSSDEISKELMESRPEIQAKIVRELGNGLLAPDGKIDKKLLAAKVFGNLPEHHNALVKLNAIVHPFVVEELLKQVEKLFAEGKRCVFNESALLFEAGVEDCYDYIVVVDAPEQTRIERVVKNRHLSESEVRSRIAAQISAEEKKQAADFVVDNSGTPAQLESAVRFLMAFLPSLSPQNLLDDEQNTAEAS